MMEHHTFSMLALGLHSGRNPMESHRQRHHSPNSKSKTSGCRVYLHLGRPFMTPTVASIILTLKPMKQPGIGQNLASQHMRQLQRQRKSQP